MALIHLIETDFAGLWKGWQEHLETLRREQGLLAEWIENGAWRIREDIHGKKHHHH
jgi:hypothetical protein